MISLLPKYEKNRVKKEYIIRFLTVASVIFSIFIVSITVPLIISYITVYYNVDFIDNISEGISKSENFEKMKNLLSITKETNRKIKILIEPTGKTERVNIVGLFYNIFKIADGMGTGKINPIKINQISYEQIQKKGAVAETAAEPANTPSVAKESGIHKITVKGHATNRANFISFLKKLEQDKNYVNVDSPVSNLVESEDINFSVVITLKDNNVI